MRNIGKSWAFFIGFALCTTGFNAAVADIGLGLSATFSFGAISSTIRAQKRDLVEDQVLITVTNVRQFFGEYDDFSRIDNDTIWDAIGISPDNPYGGRYKLSVDPNNSRQFIVSITGLSKKDCEYFVSSAWSDSVDYVASNGKMGGAVGSCDAPDGENIVRVTYGE